MEIMEAQKIAFFYLDEIERNISDKNHDVADELQFAYQLFKRSVDHEFPNEDDALHRLYDTCEDRNAKRMAALAARR